MLDILGCGDLYEGFPLQKVEDVPQGFPANCVEVITLPPMYYRKVLKFSLLPALHNALCPSDSRLHVCTYHKSRVAYASYHQQHTARKRHTCSQYSSWCHKYPLHQSEQREKISGLEKKQREREREQDLLCSSVWIILFSHCVTGWFEYDLTGQDQPYPEIKRCCALYLTKGEKRLGDHVIVGLER